MIYSAPRQGLFLLIISISFSLHTIVMMVSTENEVEKNRVQKGERLVAQLIDESALALTYEDRVSLSVIARRYTQEYDVNRIIIKDVNDETLIQVGDAPLQEAGEVINELATRNNAVIGRVEMVLMSTSMSEIAKMMWMTIFGSFFFHLMLWLAYDKVARPTKEQLRSLSREIQTYYFPDNHYLDPIEEQRRIAEEEEIIELELVRLKELGHELAKEQEKISLREKILEESQSHIRLLEEKALMSNKPREEANQQELNQSESNRDSNSQNSNNQKPSSHSIAGQMQPDYLSEKINTTKSQQSTEHNTPLQNRSSKTNIQDVKTNKDSNTIGISKLSSGAHTITSSVMKTTDDVKNKLSALFTKKSIHTNQDHDTNQDHKSEHKIEDNVIKNNTEDTREHTDSKIPAENPVATAKKIYTYSMPTNASHKGMYARKTGVTSIHAQPAPSNPSVILSRTNDIVPPSTTVVTTKEPTIPTKKPYNIREYERQRSMMAEEMKNSTEKVGRHSNNAVFKKHSIGKELSAFLGEKQQTNSADDTLFHVQAPQKGHKQEQQIPTTGQETAREVCTSSLVDSDIPTSLKSLEAPYFEPKFQNTEETTKSTACKPLLVRISFVDKYSLLKKLSDDMASSYLTLCSELLRQASIELLKLTMLDGIRLVHTPTFNTEGAVVELQSVSTSRSSSGTSHEHNRLALASMMLGALYKMLNEIIYEKHRELGQFALTVVIGVSQSERGSAMQNLLNTHALEHDVMMLLAQPEMRYIEKHIRVRHIPSPSDLSERECVYVKAIDNELLKEITKVRNSVLKAD